MFGKRQSIRLEVDDHLLHNCIPGAAIGCDVTGMIASSLMPLGDVLLYGPVSYGQPVSAYSKQIDPIGGEMGSASRQRTILSGVIGPLAVVFYIIGCFQMLLAAIPVVISRGKLKRTRTEWKHRFAYGILASGGHAATMAVVGTYHAAFAYTGFISNEELQTLSGTVVQTDAMD
jgi:hypothetical protein